ILKALAGWQCLISPPDVSNFQNGAYAANQSQHALLLSREMAELFSRRKLQFQDKRANALTAEARRFQLSCCQNFSARQTKRIHQEQKLPQLFQKLHTSCKCHALFSFRARQLLFSFPLQIFFWLPLFFHRGKARGAGLAAVLEFAVRPWNYFFNKTL